MFVSMQNYDKKDNPVWKQTQCVLPRSQDCSQKPVCFSERACTGWVSRSFPLVLFSIFLLFQMTPPTTPRTMAENSPKHKDLDKVGEKTQNPACNKTQLKPTWRKWWHRLWLSWVVVLNSIAHMPWTGLEINEDDYLNDEWINKIIKVIN